MQLIDLLLPHTVVAVGALVCLQQVPGGALETQGAPPGQPSASRGASHDAGFQDVPQTRHPFREPSATRASCPQDLLQAAADVDQVRAGRALLVSVGVRQQDLVEEADEKDKDAASGGSEGAGVGVLLLRHPARQPDRGGVSILYLHTLIGR
ncbi:MULTISPECIES: hypothetical protein [unclassified Streptomyces]|uniref:hypothetical protein n=1 Tax=unclassified Streptomyces TaxID=2593676 RepID=UPI002E18C9B9|nr:MULTISPECIES: hypothetical protein [unclassified Streptomyces]